MAFALPLVVLVVAARSQTASPATTSPSPVSACGSGPPLAGIYQPDRMLTVPSAGQRIAIDGTWVLDTNHGWREVHPVDAIVIVGT
jgi:hypothetical protein